MSQRNNENTKRPKPKENELEILKMYTFCWKIQHWVSGGECCWGYISIYENTLEKSPQFTQKIFCDAI